MRQGLVLPPLLHFVAIFPLCLGSFLVQPHDSTSVVGDVVIFQCSVNITDFGSTILYWSKDNHHLSVNDRLADSLDRGLKSRLSVIGNRTLGEYNLMIENVRRTDVGSYICSYIGFSSGGQTSRPASLTVLIPPRSEFPLCFILAQTLKSTGQVDTLWPGQTARLRCVSVGGEPPATLVWKRKNATISSTKTSESIHERVLTPSDNGVAFVCEASSPALKVPKKCEVTPLKILPTVQVRLMTREVIEGSNASYHCEASAIPAVNTIAWYFSGNYVGLNESERIIVSEDRQFITIVDIRADEDQTSIDCVASTPTGLQSRDTMKMLVTRRPVLATIDPATQGPDDRLQDMDGYFPWNSQLHVIVIMVAGSCVGVLIFVFSIIICWGFSRAKKPRRPNTRVQADYHPPPSHELTLEPLTYPGQIVYNTLTDCDTLPRRGGDSLRRNSFQDENSTGYLSSLYASIDRKGGYTPRFGSLRCEEKPVAEITPTTSLKRPIIPFSAQPLIEQDKESYKGSSSRDSISSSGETEIF